MASADHMPYNGTSHLRTDEIKRFNDGRMYWAEKRRVQDHIDHCVDCHDAAELDSLKPRTSPADNAA